jgi:hypothetical protein
MKTSRFPDSQIIAIPEAGRGRVADPEAVPLSAGQ